MADFTSVHDQLLEYQTNQIQEQPNVPVVRRSVPEYIPVLEKEEPQQEMAVGLQPQQFLFDPSMGVRSQTVSTEAREAGWGKSRYDQGEFNPGENLEDRRARSQSNGWKIANGAMKGIVTAGTTAVNTVAGIIDGALEGGYELGREIVAREQIQPGKILDASVNNFVAKTMLDIQQKSEEWFPNYRTEQEQNPDYQDEWIKHVFSANFIGDSFLKNFGFTLGAMGGGAVWTKALSAKMIKKLPNDLMKGVVASAEGDSEAAAKLLETLNTINRSAAATVDADVLAKNITEAAKAINKMQAKLQLSGSVLAAMGEGMVEGNMAWNEFMDDASARIAQEYIDIQRNLEEDVMNESDKYVRTYRYVDAFGNEREGRELNDMGQIRLEERRRELAESFESRNAYAKEQADRLASTTFLLNLPILTLSNTVQFGRMFAGGWKTSRNALSKLVGKTRFDDAGVPVANFRARGNKAINGLLASAKVGGAEAAEEMLQGYASSGAKYVADTRLTAYTDDGYDRDVMRSFGSWLRGMHEGGWQFLADTKNWQEGFMGAVTGLLGIPGRRWNGGVVGAVRESNEAIDDARRSAEALNARVNSEEFRKMWLGYTRHQKYDRELAEATLKDDEYAWHGADDKLLINDVIMFADAGRLNDLYEIVDRFSNMSQQEADAIGVAEMTKDGDNDNEVDNDPAASVAKVIEKASDIKEVIQQYKDNYDAIRTLMPVEASDDQIKEMLFTSMQIKRFEKRYLEMVSDVLEKFEPIFARQDELDKAAKNKEELISLRDSVTRILTNDVWTNLNSLLLSKPANDLLDELEKSVGDNEELQTKLKDMRKLVADRRKFYDKLVAIRDMSPEAFNKKAKNDSKVIAENEKLEMEGELDALNTVDDVKRAVFDKDYGERRNKYVEALNRVRGQKQVVDDFLKLYSVSRDFGDFYMHQNIGKMQTPVGDEALNYIFNDRLTKLNGINSEQEYLDLSDESLPSLDDFIKNRDDSGRATQTPLPREVLEASYNEAVNAIRTMMNEYVKLRNKHRASQAVRPVVSSISREQAIGMRMAQRMGFSNPQVPVAVQDTTPDAPAPASQLPPPGEQQEASIAQDGKSAVDADGRTWAVGDVVFGYHTDTEGYADGQTIMQIEGFEEKDGNIFMIARDEAGKIRKPSLIGQTGFLHKDEAKSKPVHIARDEMPAIASSEDLKKEAIIDNAEKDFVPDEDDEFKLRSGVPEVDSFEARDARKAIRDKDIAAFAKADLRDMREKNAAFAENWNAVNSRDGFRNTVLKVKTGDRVKFVIDKEFPPYNGQTQILVYTERGDFLNTLPFKGTEELRKAIMAEYESQNKPDNFTFSKMSTIWYRPKGLIRYDYSPNFAGERSLPDAGYDAQRDKNVPIIYYDKDGNAFNARNGKRRPLNDNQSLAGRIYYVVEGGDGEQYKIRLGIEHYNENNWNGDNPRIQKVRAAANKMEKAFRDLLNSTWDQRFAIRVANKEMREAITDLKKYLNIVDLQFDLVRAQDNSLMLQVKQTDNNGKELDFTNIPLSQIAEPDSFAKALANLGLSLNVNFSTFSSELDDLISSGTLTVNADSLMPKGADYWMANWDGKDFVLTQKQREIMERDMGKQKPAPDVKQNGKMETPPTAPQQEKTSDKIARPKPVAIKTGDVPVQQTAQNADTSMDVLIKKHVKEFAKQQGISEQGARAALTLAVQGPIAVGRFLNETNIDEDAPLAERFNMLYRIFNSIFSADEKQKVAESWEKYFKRPLSGYGLFVAARQFENGVKFPPRFDYVFRRMSSEESDEDRLRAAADMLGIFDGRYETSDVGTRSLDFDVLDEQAQKDILANPAIGTKEAYNALDDDQKADAILRCLGV